MILFYENKGNDRDTYVNSWHGIGSRAHANTSFSRGKDGEFVINILKWSMDINEKQSLFTNFPESFFFLLILQAIGGQVVEEMKVFLGSNLTKQHKNPGIYTQIIS